MTSQKYLINFHVLLKHFELVFIYLQLVKISRKLLIIWVNYEKNKKGSFYETPCSIILPKYFCCFRYHDIFFYTEFQTGKYFWIYECKRLHNSEFVNNNVSETQCCCDWLTGWSGSIWTKFNRRLAAYQRSICICPTRTSLLLLSWRSHCV